MLSAPASADIYVVPPAPVPVVLKNGERVISVNALESRAFSTQKVYIQLAVTGTPVFVPTPTPNPAGALVKPGVEDPTPTPLVALQSVAQTDIEKARDALIGAGIPRGAITAALPPAGRTGGRMGQILIAVSPATRANFEQTAVKVGGVLSRYPRIAAAGVILLRESCDAQRRVRSDSSRRTSERAAMLANAAGFTIGARLRDSAWFSDAGSWPYQTLCGAQLPQLPQNEAFVPETLPSLPYRISANRAVLFGLGRNREHAPKRVAFQRTEKPASLDGQLVSHQFIVPAGEPFVSAQGQFRAVVRPDAFVVVFWVPNSPPLPPPPQQLWRDVAGAVQSSGFSVSQIERSADVAYVRVSSIERLRALEGNAASIIKRYARFFLDVGAVPVVSNCDDVRRAVAASAFLAAKRRAASMAAAAHVRMGSFFAVSDAGETIGALCERRDAPLPQLVRSIQEQDTSALGLSGLEAAFSTAIVAAWRLDVPPAPRGASRPDLASPYAYSTIEQAFTTPGAGAIGAAATLQQATRSALVQMRGPLQALIDQGRVQAGAAGNTAPLERVLAVSGS